MKSIRKVISLVCVMAMVFTYAAFADGGAAYADEEEIPIRLDEEVPVRLDGETPVEVVVTGDVDPSQIVITPVDPDDEVPVRLEDGGEPGISPFAGKRLINNEHYTGSGDYEKSFQCDADDGNRLNIFVSNNVSAAEMAGDRVIVNISWKKFLNSEDYPAKYLYGVGSGSSKPSSYTDTFSYESNKGIDGTWTILVTTELGTPLDITVSARQYQVN